MINERERYKLTPRGRVEIGRFIGDPCKEFGHRAMGADTLGIIANAGQFGIGEIGVDRLVTNRVNRHRCAPLFRFGHGMMPLDQRLKRAPTQPAGVVFPGLLWLVFIRTQRQDFRASLGH